MPITRQTARMSTGGKVPHHQLAPRANDHEAGGSNPIPEMQHEQEINKLKEKIRGFKARELNNDCKMTRLVESRNVAWQRVADANGRIEELEHQIATMNAENILVDEDMRAMYLELHPPIPSPGVAELEPGVIRADGGEPDFPEGISDDYSESGASKNEEDLEMIFDFSDNENGYVSDNHSDPGY